MLEKCNRNVFGSEETNREEHSPDRRKRYRNPAIEYHMRKTKQCGIKDDRRKFLADQRTIAVKKEDPVNKLLRIRGEEWIQN